jgi:serine/threonine protein kinase
MKCPKCHLDNPDDSKFCKECGTNITSVEEAPAFTKTLETPFPQLAKGATLGDRYEIQGELGKGGMGEVYLAEDTNLKRQVAIKVLPQQFALNKERLARFEREARLLASLNHPNIATIHGLEKSDSQQFLVMELVEGETLRERLIKGALPIEEALEICKQIAEGLESAHEKGIIHRDLKPSNVKVTPEGKVKILDFGIAKAFREQSDETDISKSHAITDEMTQPGMILGTAAYMSPEQAKGRRVDKRSDIWAFGCILYECLTGKRPFGGETASEIIASILKSEPEWIEIPTATPRGILVLIRRCLQKDINRRQHDISDARIEIEDALEGPEGADLAGATVTGKIGWRHLVPWIICTAVITAVLTILIMMNQAPSATSLVIKSDIGVEPAKRLGGSGSTERRAGYWRPSRTSFALSPDGRIVIFEGVDDSGGQLFRRDLGLEKAEPIAGTEGGRDPFLSHDGQHIGFYLNGKLMRIPIDGGLVAPICDTGVPKGASWGPDDKIVFSVSANLYQVTAAGGSPEILTEPNREKGEIAHLLPHFLPDGNTVLFSIRTSPFSRNDPLIAVLSLETMQWETVIEEGADARYSPTGHIVFARQGMIMAAPFNLNRLKVKGEPKPILPDIMQAINASNSGLLTYAAQFSFADSGTMIYVPGGGYPERETRPVLVYKNGTIKPLNEIEGGFSNPRVSNVRKKIAFNNNGEIWLYDMHEGFYEPLVRSDSHLRTNRPVWTPDGKRLAYQHTDAEKTSIYWTDADGSEKPELLVENGRPSSWYQDGKSLAFVRYGSGTRYDIWIFTSETGEAKPLLNSQYYEQHPEFSPDGRFLAYASDNTGQAEVYVTPYPGNPKPKRVSNQGGHSPVWSPDMKHLYYLEISQTPRAKMIVVDIRSDPSFQILSRRVLFDSWGLGMNSTPLRGYDILPDGQGFVCSGYHFGGEAIKYSAIPRDILDGLASQNRKSLAWFERWLRQDKEREFSPELERMLQGLTVTKINIVQNWFEELKRLVPTGR